MSTGLPDSSLHEERYTVRTYEIDHQKRMTVPALVRLMQEAAMQHVLRLKLSVWDLETEGVAWVMIRLQMEIKRLPLLNEAITVETCPTGLERMLTYRNFWIYDQEGKLIAEAVTHWVLMDLDSRRLRTVPEWIIDRFSSLIPSTHTGLQPSRHKLPPLLQADRQKAFQVRWHDLDFNLHLNNTYYILYLLEGLPAEWLSEKTLSRLDITYKSEVRLRENFQVRMQQLASGQFLHQMIQGKEEKILAEMVSDWR